MIITSATSGTYWIARRKLSEIELPTFEAIKAKVVKKYVAAEMLLDAANRHDIHLSLLVAETSLWVHPDVHARIIQETRCAAMFPKVRRARISQGEKRGQVIDGIRLDDNSYANVALKRALGLHRLQLEGFEACHIWPRTCYDERFHTVVANLVLLPRALAGLSDHDVEIQASLQYRAYELYAWYPEGATLPQKPSFYPSQWRDPEPAQFTVRRSQGPRRDSKRIDESDEMSSEERNVIVRRLHDWSRKPQLNVHRVIALVIRSGNGLSREALIAEISRITTTKNAYGTVASLLTSNGNAYGRVLQNVDGTIRLHPAIDEEVRQLSWS